MEFIVILTPNLMFSLDFYIKNRKQKIYYLFVRFIDEKMKFSLKLFVKSLFILVHIIILIISLVIFSCSIILLSQNTPSTVSSTVPSTTSQFVSNLIGFELNSQQIQLSFCILSNFITILTSLALYGSIFNDKVICFAYGLILCIIWLLVFAFFQSKLFILVLILSLIILTLIFVSILNDNHNQMVHFDYDEHLRQKYLRQLQSRHVIMCQSNLYS